MRQWTVDAFAAQAFRGNQACVLEPLDAWPADAWMQALAAENNQAETAFLLKTDDPARFGLRWFTPALEVPLCGHATLASGHVLFAELGVTAQAITFDTRSGPLVVRQAVAGYEMDFPAQPPHRVDTQVHACAPDLAKLEAVSSAATGGRGNVGIAAVADAGRPYDVADRFFAPGSGIAEDPATGSLHTILTPLFADKLGRPRVSFLQAYPGRGGDLDCEVAGDRVLLRGQAVTVLDSHLRILP